MSEARTHADRPLWRKAIAAIWIAAVALVVAEGLLRALSYFVPVFDLEMLKYATSLKVRSDIPGLPHQHQPNVSARLMGVEIALNSTGHRSPELQATKSASERRIHFVGSSLTMAWGVAEADGFPARTVRMLNARPPGERPLTYVAVNGGIGNVNTANEIALFKAQMDKTEPDIVVLQYYLNDAESKSAEGDNPLVAHSMLVAFVYLRIKAMLITRGGTLQEHYASLYREGSPDWGRSRSAIQELKRITDRRGIPLVVLVIPELHDFSKDNPYNPIYATLQRTFADMGIPSVNPIEALRAAFGDSSPEAWVARDDPHPSAKAHAVLADALYETLKGMRL